MRNRWLGLAVAFAAMIASLVFWRSLPAEVVSHWNLRGRPDGTSSRLVTALVGPAAILALTLIFQLLPRIDPKRDNYSRFRDVYWLVVNALCLWILVLHVALLASGAGAPVSPEHVLAGSSAVLMVVLGNSLGRVRPNWFMGIRTPWTLEYPEVWRRTHRMAAWLFVAAGIVTGVAVLIPGVRPLEIALVATAAAVIVSILGSLVYWYQEKHS